MRSFTIHVNFLKVFTCLGQHPSGGPGDEALGNLSNLAFLGTK